MKPILSTGYQLATKYFNEHEEFTLVTAKPREKRVWNTETKSYEDTVDAYIYSFAFNDCEQVIDVKFTERQQVTQFSKYFLNNLEVYEDFKAHKLYFRAEGVILC